MKKRFIIHAATVIAILLSAGALPGAALEIVSQIPLPGVIGRIDHMAIDTAANRLYVAALGNNTMEIIDLNEGKRIRSIKGFNGPRSIVFVPYDNKIYVTNAGNGDCDVFVAGEYSRIKAIRLGENTDNMRYDPAAKRLYVGYGSGAIGVVDISEDRKTGDIILGGHPEAFELVPGSERIYINVPELRQIIQADCRDFRVQTNWQLRTEKENYPMALDEADRLLFVGCRKPEELLIFNTVTGIVDDKTPIDGDADDIFFDARGGRIFISCGAGYIDVVGKNSSGRYVVSEKVPTAPGARTSLYAPKTGKYFLAVPAQGGLEAKIMIYRVAQASEKGEVE